MKRYWPILVVILGFTALGVANVLKAPIGQSRAARETQVQLTSFNKTLPGWTSEDVPVSEAELKIAQAQAHLSRVFTNEKTKAKLSTLLLFGEPGQLGAHTPQVCFAGAGYKQIAKETKITIAPNVEFWTTRFETATFPPSTLQVIWGWGTDGVWKASENARLDFAGHALIYKLYVSRIVPLAGGRDAADPIPELTTEYLKELHKVLNRPTTSANGSPAWVPQVRG